MNTVEFFDPFATENLSAHPVPLPLTFECCVEKTPAYTATPSQRRDREKQRLIHDLALLAANRKATPQRT